MMRYLRGYVCVTIKGASPERCLNRFAQEDIAFCMPVRLDALQLSCRIYEKDLEAARKQAVGAMCAVEIDRRVGFAGSFSGLRKRPVLLLGVAAALFLAFFLQNYIWVLRVEGNERIPTEEILHALELEGVAFGAWGPAQEQESLKNRMLNRLPSLRWLALNRSGAIAQILVSEREGEKKSTDRNVVSNIVASRPGVVTEMNVLNGFAAVQVGDAVRTGQLLVSGFADWPTHTQATRAMAEVYAETLRDCTVKMPDQRWEKTATGEKYTICTLIFGRKRIKLSGNSGILDTRCDRMIETKALTLPGGWQLPLFLETVTAEPYTLRRVPMDAGHAGQILRQAAKETVLDQMIAGTILRMDQRLQKNQGAYVLDAAIFCREMISASVPAEPPGEDMADGESD